MTRENLFPVGKRITLQLFINKRFQRSQAFFEKCRPLRATWIQQYLFSEEIEIIGRHGLFFDYW